MTTSGKKIRVSGQHIYPYTFITFTLPILFQHVFCKENGNKRPLLRDLLDNHEKLKDKKKNKMYTTYSSDEEIEKTDEKVEKESEVSSAYLLWAWTNTSTKNTIISTCIGNNVYASRHCRFLSANKFLCSPVSSNC